MIGFKKNNNSIELSFLIFKLGMMKTSDHNGPFIMISFLIWRLGTTIAFSYYEKNNKGWDIIGKS